PAPALLFLYLIIAIILISALCQVFAIQGIHPATQEVLQVNSLWSFEALRWWLQNAVKNFINFARLARYWWLCWGWESPNTVAFFLLY
ncbi:MAG: AbgT family transporter, partial [Oleispira sp.]|nr:AbgT family transporter [Oleispira sp.]